MTGDFPEYRSTVHVTAPGGSEARCGATDGELISWEDAIEPGGTAFTCVNCFRDVSGGHAHVPVPLSAAEVDGSGDRHGERPGDARG